MADHKKTIEELEAELAEMERVFSMMYKANMRGIALWRAENPEARDLIWPDQAELVRWLITENERLHSELPKWAAYATVNEWPTQGLLAIGNSLIEKDKEITQLKESLAKWEEFYKSIQPMSTRVPLPAGYKYHVQPEDDDDDETDEFPDFPKPAIYGLVGEPHSYLHVVRGQSVGTVCNKIIEADWARARGLVTAEQFYPMSKSCPNCVAILNMRPQPEGKE